MLGRAVRTLSQACAIGVEVEHCAPGALGVCRQSNVFDYAVFYFYDTGAQPWTAQTAQAQCESDEGTWSG